MGLLGKAFDYFWSGGLPQTVEGCDNEIASLQKSILDHQRNGCKNGVINCKKRIVDLKAQKKKLQAKK